ncbi:hypothetical protein HYT25_04820 [Candidatus Pacearchaeota archaeon]|nr:hypothetical protein [Candidatus Pacearchaeota archaeon]
MKDSFSVFKEVFGKAKYIFLAVAIGFLFYSLNVLMANFSSIKSYFGMNLFLGIKFFFVLSMGFKETILPSSFASLVAISILLGMLFSLITYKTITIKKSSGRIGVISTTGIFLGIFAPGCAACGIGLLSVLGFGTAFLTLLPFKGLEISILAIGILTFSIAKISKDIKKGIVCEI